MHEWRVCRRVSGRVQSLTHIFVVVHGALDRSIHFVLGAEVVEAPDRPERCRAARCGAGGTAVVGGVHEEGVGQIGRGAGDISEFALRRLHAARRESGNVLAADQAVGAAALVVVDSVLDITRHLQR